MCRYKFFPDLLPEEYDLLKTSIADHGVEVPIVVDQEGDIIDGFHRQQACDELGVACPREIRYFESEIEKLELAIRLTCPRRQLNRRQKRELIAAYLRRDPQIADNCLAELIGGVSKNTVAEVRSDLESTCQIDKFEKLRGKDGKDRPSKYRKIIANTPKEAEAAMRVVGDLPDNCAGKLIDTTSARRRAQRHRTKVERERLIEEAKASALPDNITITHTDFRDLDVALESVKLVLTEVMWNEAAEADWRALGELATKWLTPDGILATYIGQNHLLAMANAIVAGGLYFQWVFDGRFAPGSNAAEVNGIVSRWRPIVVFAKEQRHIFRKTIDTFDVGMPEKEWSWLQQTVQGTRWLVEHLSDPGNTVLDPCLGTGTTAVAVLTAKEGPRTFIGCDRNEEMVRIAHQRVANELARLSAPGDPVS